MVVSLSTAVGEAVWILDEKQSMGITVPNCESKLSLCSLLVAQWVLIAEDLEYDVPAHLCFAVAQESD
jgi:hypothetical protein